MQNTFGPGFSLAALSGKPGGPSGFEGPELGRFSWVGVCAPRRAGARLDDRENSRWALWAVFAN